MNPLSIKPEDRYTVVRRVAPQPGRTFEGYSVTCKSCGLIDRRRVLIEAKEVRDTHEDYHQSGADGR